MEEEQEEEEEGCHKGGVGRCCLRSARVSFAALGRANWVSAPRSLCLRFCQGSCPHDHRPASLHVRLKAWLHRLSREAPGPCCVPTAYKPIVLTRHGPGGRLAASVPDMMVTRCHCA